MEKKEYVMTLSHTFYWAFLRPEKINQNQFVQRINKEILQDIIDNKISLNIELTNEGDLDESSIELIKNQLKELGILYNNVSFTHSCYKMPNSEIKTIFIDKHFNLKSKQSYEFNKLNKLHYENGNKKPYKFHIPNRRLRQHRVELLEQLFLYDKNFIEDNLVSFDINVEWNIESLEKHISSEEFKNYIFPKKENRIDQSNLSTLTGYDSEFTDVYKNSYITIVTETFFHEPYYYISEKAYKPLMQQHPFILIGRPFYLKYLKEIGFKTFDSFIDESYDLIQNNELRFNHILNEIKRLNELPKDDLHILCQNLKDVLIHNQNVLINHGEENFKNKLI